MDLPESSVPDDIDRRIMLHMPVDVRSASLAFIAIASAIVLLRWTEEFVVPVLLGVMLSYSLTPIVDRLEALRIPRMVGAGLVLAVLLAASASGMYALRGQADKFLTALPQLAVKIRQSIVGTSTSSDSTLARVELAATAIQSAATGQTVPTAIVATRSSAPGEHQAGPAVKTPADHMGDTSFRGYIVSGTLGIVAFLGETLVVLFVALFLLATGNTFRRKIIKLAGPKLSHRKGALQALDEVHSQIQKYLLVQFATSLLVGVATAIAFYWIGLENAMVWGVVAGIANLVPYLGSVVTSGLAGVAGLVQFGRIDEGLWLAALSFAIHLIVGNLITPLLTGRTSKMSPFVVFVSVLFFGWLWGVAGLILAFPLLVAVKITCERIEDLKPIGELLSG